MCTRLWYFVGLFCLASFDVIAGNVDELFLLYRMAENQEMVRLEDDLIDEKFFKLYTRANSVFLDNKYKKLQSEAEAAHARETSLANRLLSGATMAATGIGGMQLASGMAEKAAMEDAERDMRAYLATFVCDYGSGRNIKGGEVDIELPVSPEIATLKSEYIALAMDIKSRKEALGMPPGIESELVLDSSSSGLYENESIGKTDGVYTSVSRALTDENSEDASEWASQKEAVNEKIKVGATVGGVGLGGGAVGNLIINKGKK